MTKLSLTLAMVLATSALASGAHAATTVDVSKQQGSNVFTSFSSSTPITCTDGTTGEIDVFGSVSGSDSLSKEIGSPRSFSDGVLVEIDEYVNSCTGAFVSGLGNIQNGYVPPDKKLRMARLTGSTTFQDFTTGQTYPVSIDLKVEGTGPITASKDNTVSHGSGPFTVTVMHTASASREGIVTGTISIAGVELNATFSTTTLFASTLSTITVTRN